MKAEKNKNGAWKGSCPGSLVFSSPIAIYLFSN